VLGTTYAVMMGFMLYAVWGNFETAKANADAEASSLVNMVRSSRGLATAPREQILKLAGDYVSVILTKEWPAMGRGELSPASSSLVRQLWTTLTTLDVQTRREQIVLEQTLTELARMAEYRRLRQLQVDAYLPGILWFVLTIGAIITIMSACLFGTSDFRMHLIQVVMLALMISSILIAIGDINRPFQGAVCVTQDGFVHASKALSEVL